MNKDGPNIEIPADEQMMYLMAKACGLHLALNTCLHSVRSAWNASQSSAAAFKKARQALHQGSRYVLHGGDHG